MTRHVSWVSVSVVLALISVSCSEVTDVSTSELARVVERDGVAFVLPSMPEIVLDRLSAHQVVVVGETHQIREHNELMAELIRALHSRGFRQLLLEWPHLADWLLSDFVAGGQLEPQWEPAVLLNGGMITAVRDFNRSLPEEDRIHVRGIDVNLEEYGGAREFVNSLQALSKHLLNPGPVESFLQSDNGVQDEHEHGLEVLRNQLQEQRGELVDAWGVHWYDVVSEMVEVELLSVAVRGIRDSQYELSVQVREAVMKQLADRRLDGYGHRTVINVGGNHAQKEYLKGTNHEWLGDYLVHKSAVVGGSVVVLNVTPARGEPGTGGAIADWDLMDASPQNEIFRLMNEIWPGQIVFLPLNDPVFMTGGVRMNFEGEIYEGAPKRHYDVFVLLPVAHHLVSEIDQ